MTPGISSSGSVNGPVFREFEINPNLNGPPIDAPFSLTAFAHKSLSEIKENPRGVFESIQPFIFGGVGFGVMAVTTELLPFNIFTAPPLIAGGVLLVINLAADELRKQASGEESFETVEGFSLYSRGNSEEQTTNKVNTAAQSQWLERVENLKTNPARLDEKVFKASIDKGEMPDIFRDAVLLTTIETPVAFAGDASNLIFDLGSLNLLKKDANERKTQLTHPLTREPLDFSKLVFLPNVKEQIEEAKKHVKE